MAPNPKLTLVIPIVIIVVAVTFLLHGLGNNLTFESGPDWNQRDISDIFVPIGKKYDKKDNVIYHCLSGDAYKSVEAPSKVKRFVNDVNHYVSEGAESRLKVFQDIYNSQKFMEQKTPTVDKMSEAYRASGPGSSLEAAQDPLMLLHSLIERLKIYLDKPVISILDVPCGDFFWMKQLVGRRSDVNYTGIDIVPEIIGRHRMNYKTWQNARFLNIDIVTSELNEPYDVIFSRHLLNHLTLADALTVLDHFSRSGSKLLVTSQMKTQVNSDLDIKGVSRYRPVNLMLYPFNLVPPICIMPDDYLNSLKELAIWELPLKQRD